MDSFFERADAICRRCDVLRHPFYQRWSRGELSRGELAHYAGQYRHAVVALSDATARAGNSQHAEEERNHIGLWDQFLISYGGDKHATPTAETAACAASWAAPDRDRVATLASLYAIESSQPAIAETKRTGLVAHYGAAPGGDATCYFDVHAALDHDHAEQDRRELSGLMRPADEERLLDEVEGVLAANWLLLDGVQAVCAL